MLVVLPLLCAVCAAFVGYRAGAVAWRRKQKEDQAKGVRMAVRAYISLTSCRSKWLCDCVACTPRRVWFVQINSAEIQTQAAVLT